MNTFKAAGGLVKSGQTFDQLLSKYVKKKACPCDWCNTLNLGVKVSSLMPTKLRCYLLSLSRIIFSLFIRAMSSL
jgi:hypothetical protein